MALVKPIAQGVSAFDATKNQTFSFVANGGSQVVANRITIRLQTDNSIIYQNKIESYRFEQTVPAGTLTNDNYYNFYFNTYDSDGNESENSNVIQFYCYNSPTLTLTNLPLNDLVESTNYTFGVTYNQIQGELLNYLKFYLYDERNNLINESEFYTGENVVPVSFTHTFSGLENNVNYKMNVIAVTINGTTVSTDYYSFNVRYYYPELYSLLNLENLCENGCVRIESNIVIVDGEVPEKYDPPRYIKSLAPTDLTNYVKWQEIFTYDMLNNQPISVWMTPSMIDLVYNDNYVQWTKGYSIRSNFTFTLFMKAGYFGKFATIGTEDNGFTIELIREIPYGKTEVKDRFEVNGYVNGVHTVHQTSNYVDIINQKSYYLVWFRKVGDTYDLRFVVLQRANDIFGWDESNLVTDRLTDMSYRDEQYTKGVEFVPMSGNMSSIFPTVGVKLYNGIFNNMNLTNDVTSEFTTVIPQWDSNTRVACDFDNNIRGGNIDILLKKLTYLKVKRREHGTFNWITLKEYKISEISDLIITLDDYYIPSYYYADYALVPLLEGNVEGDYIVNSIKTKFNCVTIADSNNVFNLRANISYGGDTANSPIGTYSPLNGLYPILQKNSELEYMSGSITALVAGYNFNKTHKIDRLDVVKQTNDLCKFFNNMSAKILKDWNGKIYLVRFTGSPTISYNSSYGNGVAQITVNFVEQGEFDNQHDLYYNGLIDVE